MKAVWYERTGLAEEVLVMGEMPTPSPGPGEVRVKLHASGVNPSDCNRRRGAGYAMEYPRVIPNSDGAGIVDQIGEGVPGSLLHQRVWLYNGQRGRAFGTAAEYIALPADLISPLPEQIDFADGACLGIPAMTAHRCVFADGAVTGQTVLVTGGAGAVGHYAIQLAKWGGARVVATVSSDLKAEHARAAGADAIINYQIEDVVARIMDATEGEGVDRIVEVDFGANLPVAVGVLKLNGTLASYASVGNREPTFPYSGLSRNNITLHLVVLNNCPYAARRQAQRDITRWVGTGQGVHRVWKEYPLAETAHAHKAVESGGKLGTVVVTI
jgi:NADPH2:quinone reductase